MRGLNVPRNIKETFDIFRHQTQPGVRKTLKGSLNQSHPCWSVTEDQQDKFCLSLELCLTWTQMKQQCLSNAEGPLESISLQTIIRILRQWCSQSMTFNIHKKQGAQSQVQNVQKSYTPVSTTVPIKNQIKPWPRQFVERHSPSDFCQY